MAHKIFDLNGKNVWVAGETGLVGSAVVRRLESENVRIISAPHHSLDLTRQGQTEDWLADHRPDVIILAAACVGGILANKNYPADFIQANLAIAHNVIHGAFRLGVDKLLFLGSSCIYPKEAVQPIKEESLLTGPLEETNEYYALAKIVGLKMCQAYRRQYGCDYISVMPTNLYGPADRFDPQISHVIPGMMVKLHQAKMNRVPRLELWGTGRPLREFLYSDDLADSLVHVLEHYSHEMPLNIGSGQEISVYDLALMLKDVTGYQGEIVFNTNYPDGTLRKRLDCSRLNALGWEAITPLQSGLEQTYQWFLEQCAEDQAA